MVTRLLGRQFGYRGKNTIRITRQHDDILWLTIHDTRNACIGNKLDRVRTARVLRDAHVVIVGVARRGVVHDVFENRAKADRVKDFGLFFAREVDAFSVAATFNVENTRVGPDMLVISDELSAGVGRKGAGRG